MILNVSKCHYDHLQNFIRLVWHGFAFPGVCRFIGLQCLMIISSASSMQWTLITNYSFLPPSVAQQKSLSVLLYPGIKNLKLRLTSFTICNFHKWFQRCITNPVQVIHDPRHFPPLSFFYVHVYYSWCEKFFWRLQRCLLEGIRKIIWSLGQNLSLVGGRSLHC